MSSPVAPDPGVGRNCYSCPADRGSSSGPVVLETTVAAVVAAGRVRVKRTS